MRHEIDDDFRSHLKGHGVRVPKKGAKIPEEEIQATITEFSASPHHQEETPEQLRQRAIYHILWNRHSKSRLPRKFVARNSNTLILAALQVITILLLFLLFAPRAHAQVDCVKWQASDGSTVANFCAPFVVKAGTGTTFSKSANVVTLNAGGGSTPSGFDYRSATGAGAAWTLSGLAPPSINNVLLQYNGNTLQPGVDFTLVGSAATLSFTATATDQVFAYVTSAQYYAPTGSGTTWTMPFAVSQNNILVSVNGITQRPGADFTVSGAVITLAWSLAASDKVFVYA